MTRALLTALMLILPLLTHVPHEAQISRLGPRGHGTGHEFTFARLEYQSWGRRQTWTVDWPKADEQFIIGLKGWVQSHLAISDTPATVAINDPALFGYPFVYAVEPGYMELSDDDAQRLREYLSRGGFLVLDDFWGEPEWDNVQRQIHKIFPEYPIRELPLDHPLLHCYFDIRDVVQVPNFHVWLYSGQTSEKGGIVPSYHIVQDDEGRLLVFIARNDDNGDAWEWIDDPRYPLKYGLAAYRLGMNLIVYSMSH